jgi:carbon dioxide concentrating mechanism protein CcmL
MELARVIGSVSATLKDGGLHGLKLALVQVVDETGTVVRTAEVAVDTQSAGIGELVLIVRGSGARQPELTRGVASDLTVVAIVDNIRLAKPAAAPKTTVTGGGAAVNKRPTRTRTT